MLTENWDELQKEFIEEFDDIPQYMKDLAEIKDQVDVEINWNRCAKKNCVISEIYKSKIINKQVVIYYKYVKELENGNQVSVSLSDYEYDLQIYDADLKYNIMQIIREREVNRMEGIEK
jgi:hypothetical protein